MDDLLREMITPLPPPAEAARRRRVLSTVAILGLAGVGLTGLTTSAFFTDGETVTSNGITIGSLDLTTDDLVLVGGSNLAPGGSTFGEITVTNSGSLGYRYALSYRADDVVAVPDGSAHTPGTGASSNRAHLSSLLRLRVYANVTCSRAGTATDVGGAVPSLLASVGHVDRAGALSTDWAALVGDPATGQQAGDRTLGATASETLCVRLDLSADADDRYQETSSEISIRFDAEQTIDNP